MCASSDVPALVFVLALAGAACDPGAPTEREAELLDLINEAREAGAVCPSGPQPAVAAVPWDNALGRAARAHAEDMAQQNYFDHVSLDGRQFFDRVNAQGYGGVPRSENLAAGSDDPETTLSQWLSSDGHCLNLMDPTAVAVGLGYARDDDSDWVHYWVQVMGARAP
jgi:uncharacterized protein YkwD